MSEGMGKRRGGIPPPNGARSGVGGAGVRGGGYGGGGGPSARVVSPQGWLWGGGWGGASVRVLPLCRVGGVFFFFFFLKARWGWDWRRHFACLIWWIGF